MFKNTVLVVDADAAHREMVKAVLQKEGYHALEASNGLQALVIALNRKNPIDLLMADVALPGIDGTRLLEKFSNGFPGTPSTLLSKPVEKESLVREVRDLLRRGTPKKGAERSLFSSRREEHEQANLRITV